MHLPLLAIDVGGTKTLIAVATGDKISHIHESPTPATGNPDDILDLAYDLYQKFILPKHALKGVAMAVTGGVTTNGEWFALNKKTLNIPRNYELLKALKSRFKLPALALNDAQAAAFAEYKYGAALGQDCVFLTVSTGLGGGIIANGALLKGASGLAGHFGIMQWGGAQALELRISGRWMAHQARIAGYDVEAKQVFRAAKKNEKWAEEIVNTSAKNFAALIADIALALNPPVFVIGGSIGLAEGYLPQVKAYLSAYNWPMGRLDSAQLGKYAPAIGAAAYFEAFFSTNSINLYQK